MAYVHQIPFFSRQQIRRHLNARLHAQKVEEIIARQDPADADRCRSINRSLADQGRSGDHPAPGYAESTNDQPQE